MTSSLLFRAAASGALLAGACLLAAGCSAGGSTASSSPGMGARAVPARAVPGSSPAQGSAESAAGSAPAGHGTSLTAQPAAPSIIYTASVTVRALDLTRAAAQATQLARAAGGYVSSENTALNRAQPDRSTVSLELKIPASAYPATLGALSSQLGTRLAM